MRLEARLLLRDWRGGQLNLILSALILAVAVVASVSLLTDRVERGLTRQISSFLAADLVIRSGVAIPPEFRNQAQTRGLATAQTAGFQSMVFAGDASHLASVKAVSDAYPLRGELIVSDVAFAPSETPWRQIKSGPPQGEVWVDERLLPLLGIQLGDRIEIGYQPLRVSRVLIAEPDRGSGFAFIGARVLMHLDDLPATGVVQPGSRIRYRLLLAGDGDQIDAFSSWAKARKTEHQRIVKPEEAEQRISNALTKGRSFLLLAGVIGVLLAGVALALASHRYAERLTDRVALMKTWGQSAGDIRRRYLTQLTLLGLFCTAAGIALGWSVHWLLLYGVRELVPAGLPAPGVKPFAVASLTGVSCILGFAMPALWHLPGVAPLRVLRRDLPQSAIGLATRLGAGVATLLVLVFWYGDSPLYASLFLAGLAGVLIVTGLISAGLLGAGARLGHWAGSVWRLALASLSRHQAQTLVQMIAFATAIMLLLVMIGIRTSLLGEWRAQLPPDAPNHFLVNVAPGELDAVNAQLAGYGLPAPNWYPLVRGRAVGLNGEAISDEQMQRSEGLRRELNMTWSENLPPDNRLLDGGWWPAGSAEAEFSMEQEFAAELGLQIGDGMTFSIGGLKFDARLTNIRSVDWDSMNPNFYFIFPRQVLEKYPQTWMTSVHIGRADKLLVNDILKAYPTVLVIALDEIFNRVRSVIQRVTQGLEMIMLMVLGCGALVLFAAIGATFDERMQEAAVLRTLGSSGKLILGSLAIEFITLGLIAGLVAAVCAEGVIMALQYWVFDIDIGLHPRLWIAGILTGALVVGGLGLLRSWRVVRVPPLQSLRALQ